jgi:hypothetical protein
MSDILPLVILNARPAAGKSEIIRFLRQLGDEERKNRFHLGPLHIIDDFPMLWTWFEEDHLLDTIFNQPRLYTDEDQYFLHDDLWNLLIRRLDLEYTKYRRDSEDPTSVILEFSRGAQHGGYQTAYQHISEDHLAHAAALYIKVSWEESLRKNRARYNPDRPDSILEHGLSDEKMERLYSEDDWEAFTQADPEYISVRDQKIPYAVFDNEDDLTTHPGPALEQRLQQTLDLLWERWKAHQAV